jgi:hypothetical protein
VPDRSGQLPPPDLLPEAIRAHEFGADRTERTKFVLLQAETVSVWAVGRVDRLLEPDRKILIEVCHALSIAPNPNLLKVIGAIKAAADARNRLKRHESAASRSR